ncbi:related to DUF1275 domain protein [Cephalotrichum gorgonifer]|uniref:Related to DUF1275 domain protein n=1 Tax=Cephalotrichum gorgonifer TaxID=2041049 RepID=A0AAE8MWB4_9PEZI|nr:related to DUF1275 domain protein [Cephalotrichum gorgonifer]
MSQPTKYGTVGDAAAAPAPAPANGPVVDEEQSVQAGKTVKSRRGGIRRRLTVDLNREWADIVLILCYLITGLLDSASISIWRSFVSMQTGNTVYIGLGLARPAESKTWVKSLTSLACFCVGSIVFSRFHRFFSPKRRWVLTLSFIVQFFLIAAAASMVTWGPDEHESDELGWNVLAPIALIAFQSAGQAVASRALKFNALTSVVLTSIYCDLFSDPFLLKLDNPERNRRLAAPIMLLVGAIAGGLFSHSFMGIAGALWAAAILKFFAVVAWLLWPEERVEE